MVSRNLERANENDGFKMTALEVPITNIVLLSTAILSIRVLSGKSWTCRYIIDTGLYRNKSKTDFGSALHFDRDEI